jgi:hypothetical protein
MHGFAAATRSSAVEGSVIDAMIDSVIGRYRLVPLAAIALLWCVSLALPALVVRDGPMLDGTDLFLRGWRGVSHGIVAWYANPLFFCALVLAVLRRDGACTVAALLALVLALTSFALEPLLGLHMKSVPDVVFSSGMYVWLGALLALAAWSLLTVYRGHSRQDPKLDNLAEKRD